MSIEFGTIHLDPPLFMAPMEGITDVPFRKVVREHGCTAICTQMIHAEGLLHGTQRRMEEVTALVDEEKPVGMQLCGSDPSTMGEAAQKAEGMGFAFLDINMGCPAKNVVKLGSGAGLLRTPSTAGAIVRTLVRNVSVPVTVKIRAGWDQQYRNALEIARIVEQEGASLLSVHARTRSQKFKGKADWNLITELKERLQIPVVGNGDVVQPEDVDAMLKRTGADGVMIARGALGNPWLFSKRRPTVREVHSTLLSHLEHHLSFYPRQEGALITFRKHLVWYTKGLKNAAEFRLRVFQERSLSMVRQMIDRFFDQFDPTRIPLETHGR